MKRAAAKISQLVKGKKKKIVFEPFQTNLPLVIEKCCSWLELNGLTVDGIFRVSPVYKDVLELKKKFDASKLIDLPQNANPHVISGVLKLWFCELEQPILTFELYDAFIAAMVPTDAEVRHYRTVEVLRLLPPANRTVVMRLSQLLVSVDRKKTVNRMPAANLAIIFASAMLRCRDASLQQLLDDSQLANNLILSFIVNYEALFLDSFKPGVLSNLRRTKPSTPDEVFFADTLLRAQTLLASVLMEYEQFYDQEKQVEEAGRKKLLMEHVNDLKKVLRIPLARDFLKQYLVHELSEENLMFWLDVEKYKKVGAGLRPERCMEIYTNYIIDDSVLQVNIDGEMAQTITSMINKKQFPVGIFDEAQDWVFRLMETHSFPRFVRSHQFNSLIEKMAEVDELEVDPEFDEPHQIETEEVSKSSVVFNHALPEPAPPASTILDMDAKKQQEDEELAQLERELQSLEEEEERHRMGTLQKRHTELMQLEEAGRLELLIQLEEEMKHEEEVKARKLQEEAERKRKEEEDEKRRREEAERKWKLEQEARLREEGERKIKEQEEKRKLEEERAKLEREKQIAEERLRQIEKEKREQEERAAREIAEAARRLAEEQRKREEEMRRKLEADRKSLEEKRRLEELNRQKALEEQKRLEDEQRRKWEEKQRLLEQQERQLKEEAERRLAEYKKKLEEEKRHFEEEQKRWAEEKKKQQELELQRKQEETERRKRWEEEQRKAIEEQARIAREEEEKRKQQQQKRLQLEQASQDERRVKEKAANEEKLARDKAELERKHKELLEKRRKRQEESQAEQQATTRTTPSFTSSFNSLPSSSSIFAQDRAKLREEAIKRIEEKNKQREEEQKRLSVVAQSQAADAETAQKVSQWQQHIKNIVLHAKQLDTWSQTAVSTPASFERAQYVAAVDQISKETKACVALIEQGDNKKAVVDDIKGLAHAAINFLRKVESTRPPWSPQDTTALTELREELCRKSLYQLLGSLKKASVLLTATAIVATRKVITTTVPSSNATSAAPVKTRDETEIEKRKKEYLQQLDAGSLSGPGASAPPPKSVSTPASSAGQDKLINDPSFASIYYDDGSYYEGGVKDEKCHGKGKYVFPTGNVYEGEFNEGHIHGIGTLIYAKGDRYEGEFKEDKRDGRGRYTAANGDIYTGEYKQGKRHGQGTYKMSSGASYTGSYVNGLPNGYGVYIFENGDKYEGNFVDDFFHGTGTYRSANGALYSGEYIKGKKNGKGKLVTAKGDVYEGDFITDSMEGFGVYRYVNGDIFRGQFKAGKFEGQGTYTFAAGQQIIGIFKNGRPVQ